MRITDEELKSIRDQQTKIAEVKQDLGTLEIRKHEVMNIFFEINKEVESTKKELEKNYGRVNINLEDGSFTEIEEKVTE
jgi:vacuolar-type H+-ATPase subunit D/Vma8|tara:strand:- start:91 stop:327 length:237 start_codon:yes stop_codon:yes gene_type:complete